MKRSHFLGAALITAVVLASCSKSNEKDVSAGFYGGNLAGCDTTNMRFSANIKPILESNCYACHSNSNYTISGAKLEDYTDLVEHVEHGDVIGAITHAAGYPAMPQNAPKLSDCDINKIKAWIDRGALNN